MKKYYALALCCVKWHHACQFSQWFGREMEKSARLFVYGLLCSGLIILSWGSISLLLKLTRSFTDPLTFTWLRFAFAAVFMLFLQARGRHLAQFAGLPRRDWGYLILAAIFLIGNYACASWGVGYIAPEAAMLVLQLAPLFLAVGGCVFLHEQVGLPQWGCFGLIFAGLLACRHRTLEAGFSTQSAVLSGVAIMVVSALSWSVFALLQKVLMRRLQGANILLAVYVVAAILLTPLGSPMVLLHLTADQMLLALAACVDTVLAYWSFTQALRYWQTVQVSSVIALSPVAAFLFTLLVVHLGWWPEVIHASRTDVLSLAGMVVVVLAAIGVQMVGAGRKVSVEESAAPCPNGRAKKA